MPKDIDKIDNRIKKILISSQEIILGIEKAAQWVNINYQNKDLVIVSILKGVIPFIGNLMPKVTVDFETDFISVSSFKGTISASTLPEILSSININVKNKDVLLVEDIVDSGRTITLVMDVLKKEKPASLKLLTLLDKPKGRKVVLKPDYGCFEIPEEFVVGFGLDYQEKMRNLPYIGILKEEIYLESSELKNRS